MITPDGCISPAQSTSEIEMNRGGDDRYEWLNNGSNDGRLTAHLLELEMETVWIC